MAILFLALGLCLSSAVWIEVNDIAVLLSGSMASQWCKYIFNRWI